mgnify:CR=1 FL=1
MKNKELLLDRDPARSPVRFIFSHSALREGWDNPNVFQICTLKQSGSDVRKRQEVGRGLRLCVNQNGGSIAFPKQVFFTVIPFMSDNPIFYDSRYGPCIFFKTKDRLCLSKLSGSGNYRLEENPDCPLNICDIVVLDPVATGYGQILDPEGDNFTVCPSHRIILANCPKTDFLTLDNDFMFLFYSIQR